MRPLPVADKGSKKSFAAVKIFELMKCDKNFGYCTVEGRCLLQVVCCIPLICVAPSLLKEGGPLAVGGFYGAVLLQLERMAQPRRVYGVIC